MATKTELENAILDKLFEQTTKANNATSLLKLAEAYAWLVAPDNAHGSDVTVGK